MTETKRWNALQVSPAELRLEVTLTNGQAFGFRKCADGSFIGVLGRNVIRFRETASDVEYCLEHGDADAKQLDATVRDYLTLSCSQTLAELYKAWSTDTRFNLLASAFPGVRLCRQDPLECLFSFVCSSNNHISRITKMLSSLRRAYGDKLCTIDGQLSSAQLSAVSEVVTAFPLVRRRGLVQFPDADAARESNRG